MHTAHLVRSVNGLIKSADKGRMSILNVRAQHEQLSTDPQCCKIHYYFQNEHGPSIVGWFGQRVGLLGNSASCFYKLRLLIHRCIALIDIIHAFNKRAGQPCGKDFHAGSVALNKLVCSINCASSLKTFDHRPAWLLIKSGRSLTSLRADDAS